MLKKYIGLVLVYTGLGMVVGRLVPTTWNVPLQLFFSLAGMVFIVWSLNEISNERNREKSSR